MHWWSKSTTYVGSASATKNASKLHIVHCDSYGGRTKAMSSRLKIRPEWYRDAETPDDAEAVELPDKVR